MVNATVSYTAKNGASLKNVSFDFGDGTAPVVTTNTSQSHTYSADGTYTIAATLSFNVGDTTQTARCTKTVTITTPTTPPSTPPAPTQLPNTGPGSVVGVFAGVSALAGAAHYIFSGRRARQ